MDKQEILKYIFGDVTVDFLIAFYFFSLIGVFLSMLFHYGKKQSKDFKAKKITGFSLGYWLKDNIVRLLTSIICIFILVRFYDQIPIHYELNMFLGLLTGLSLDQLIVYIRNKTSINIFQSK